MGHGSVVSVGSRHKMGHGSVISVGSRHKIGQGSVMSVGSRHKIGQCSVNLQEGAKLQEHLRQSTQALDRCKKQYEKAFRDSEKAMDNYRKADADINLSRADVEKQRMVMNQKAQTCEECKSEYANVLQQFNSSQQEHYYTLMPQVFQQLHDMEEKRINKVQECIQQCSVIEKNIIPIINTCIEGIAKASASIDSAQDSKLVVERHKSGFPIPQDVSFEDLSVTGGSTTSHTTPTPIKNTSKRRLFGFLASSKQTEDQKEDFSDLPPSQRKRKLKQKIDSIKKDMGKEQSEREGMLKLKDVYTNNPALGDPNTLEKKVEENAQKLDSIRQELHKFEGYLADCEGRQRRSSMSGDSVHSSDSGQQQQSVSAPGTPQQPHDDAEDGNDFADDFVDGDLDEEEEFAIGTCLALYSFTPNSDEAIPMEEEEEMQILEGDKGDGWTRVRKNDGQEGFVPTTYIQCHFNSSG
ncbi:hypothetical protein ACOMHN_004614 [Nucella lapillus]